ncbi:MAG: lipoyl(octanoyl) transferase LipB [Actinobacteria bacterium]|nr:lipoyl(octanoyl) transferase LipB [Actinomycetota bacterium]
MTNTKNNLTGKIENYIERYEGTEEIPCLDLGLIGYDDAFRVQMHLFEKVRIGQIRSLILLLEHYPVITIGNSGKTENLLAGKESLKEQGIELVQSNRGGDITFHGPGQLVCYPIINLTHFEKDLTSFIWNLEQVIIDFLNQYDIKGTRIDKLRGVFTGSNKIASIGLHVKKWITIHGFALNVNVDLNYFNNIIACGLKDYNQTSMKKILNKNIPIGDVKEQVLLNFCKIFKIKSNLFVF